MRFANSDSKATMHLAAMPRPRDLRLAPMVRVIVSCCLSFTVVASTAPPAFAEGNLLYDQGDYAGAAEAYESLLDQGVSSPALLHNHGNALYRSGQIGRAILQYRRGLRLAPRDRDLQAGLHTARLTVSRGEPIPPSFWQRWLRWLSVNEWALLTSVLVWGGCVWLSWTELRTTTNTNRNRNRNRTIAVLMVGALSLGTLGLAWRVEYGAMPAVIGDGGAVVHYGPLEESPRLRDLPEGSEIRVTEKRKGWALMSDTRFGTGWIRSHDLLWLDPRHRFTGPP